MNKYITLKIKIDIDEINNDLCGCDCRFINVIYNKWYCTLFHKSLICPYLDYVKRCAKCKKYTEKEK